MSSTFQRLGQSELLPRYIFAESLVARRRVLEIGAVASTKGQSARFLSTRGARIVVAADADLAAVQDAQSRLAGPSLRFRPTVFDDFEAGSFDLVIVSDLAPYVRAPELLKEVARLVAKSGFLMGGLRNPAGLALAMVLDAEEAEAPPTYGQLLDALSVHFKSVDVATQSPVLGYQLAFERGEGLQVDGSLAGSSEAAYYVVLAGHEEVRSFDPTWVQLPPEPLAFTGGKLEDAANRARDWRDRSERLKDVLEKKSAELQSREAQLHELKEQLEASKEAVSRLTAQLESLRDRPEVVRDREDLATRIRQMESELQVSRERAIDAEGRVTASRNELTLLQRTQKDAAIQTLAAQETARLERARREELGTQLEDGRLRLAKAYEETRRTQDDLASERVEHERTKIAIERLKETIADRERTLGEAKERELKLADARTEALQAVENLESAFAQVRSQLAEARELVERKELDRVSAVRSYDVEHQARIDREAEVQRELARANSLQDALNREQHAKSGAETELASARSNIEKLSNDLETTKASEARWKTAFEERGLQLDEARSEHEKLEQREVELRRSLDEAQARATTLQTELAQAQSRIAELELLLKVSRENADRLTEVVASDATRIRELEGKLTALTTELQTATGTISSLEQQLTGARDDHSKAEERLAAAGHKLQSLEQAIASAQARIKELSDDGEMLLMERDDVRGALSDVEKIRAEQGQRLNELSDRTESLTAKLSEVEGALAEAQRTLAQTSQDASSQERALKGLLEARERSLADEQAQREQLERLRDQLRSELTETTSTLERERTATEALRQEHQAKVAALTEEIASTRKAVEAAKTSRELLDLERIDLEKRYASLQGDARLVSDRATELEGQIRGLLSDLRAAETTADERKLEWDDQRAALEDRIRQHRSRADRAEKDLADAKASLTEAGTRAAAAGQEHERLTKALVEQSAAGVEQSARIETLTSSLTELQAEHARTRDGLQRAETSLEETRAALADASARLATTTQALSETKSALEQRTTEIAELERRLTESGAALRVTHAELETLRTEREATRATTEQLQRDLQAARGDVRVLDGLIREREATVATTSQALQKLEQEKKILGDSLATAMSEAEHQRLELEEALHARDGERSLRETDSQKLSTELAAAKSELEAARSTVTERQAELERLQASLQAQREHGSSLEASERSLQLALDETRAELQRAKQEQRDTLAAVERAQSEARGHQSSKSTLQRQLDVQLSELETLREASSVARAGDSAALSELRVQLSTLEAERNDAKTKLEAAETAKDSQVAELQQQLQKAQSEHAETRVRLEQLEVSKSQSGELKLEQLEALTVELGVARAKITELEAGRAQTAELQQRLRVVEGEAARGKRDREALESAVGELGRLRAQLPVYEAEIQAVNTAAQRTIEVEHHARLQAEELLLALRSKYGDLQHEMSRAGEMVVEGRAENEILTNERDRLKRRIKMLEKALETRPTPLPQPMPSVLPERPVEVFELDVDDEPGPVAEELDLLEDEPKK